MMRLEATAISAGYGGKDVLEAIDLTVQSGEFVGLIGPNGCGKSTLLRVLTQIVRPHHGAVRLDSQPITRLTPLEIARRVAFVPQEEAAAFDFTVRDIVLMGRYPHRSRGRGETPEDFAIVERALADLDILHLAERSITQLSGGEHRRVLLARALAQQVPLLLLDEPTAHLDITHQVEILGRVLRLTRERQVGALAALHDLNHAAEFCDRLVLLAAGRKIAEGTPEAVLTSVHLHRAYGAQARIGRNPVTGRPMALEIRSSRQEAPLETAPQVHVVCGGGAGIAVLGTLCRYGFAVTAGVLNRLDSDQEAAEALEIEVVLESPFSPIGPAAREACAALMARAETILVAPCPFGYGNLANLELVAEAQAAGKRILLLGDTNFAARDYTSGAATTLLERLLACGAEHYDRLEDWPALVASSPSETPR